MKSKIIILAVLLNINFLFAQSIGCWKKVIPGKDALGGGYIIGLANDGKLFGWGKNSKGQLGIGNYTNLNVPQQIGTAIDWKTFDVGSANVIAIKNNGTLWTWGSGESTGLGTISNITIPTQVGIANDWKDVYAGDYNVYAIKNNGTLWASGRNASGSLGNGNNTIQLNLIQIGTDSDWKEISGGNIFTLGIKTNGTLWSWGSDSIGQLGNGTSSYSDVEVPTQISNLNWVSISAGKDHVIAIQSDGSMWAWGSNSFGQLGINSTTSKSSPIQVGTESDWLKISAGSNHNTAMKSSGQIFVWGRNSYSALGIGYNENALQNIMFPYPLEPTNDWKTVTNGSFNSVAIKQNGDLFLWGRGLNGEMGNGSNSYEQSSPLSIICPTVLSNSVFKFNNSIAIYPNPFHDSLNIESKEVNLKSLTLIDLQGRIIREEKVSGNGYKLNLENLPQAVYILKISSEKGKQSVKVVKK